jgi:cold shock CspA family protein
MNGVIVKYDSGKAYGFIRGDGMRHDTFFHKRAMVGGITPAVDMIVQFVEELDQSSGRIRATNVRPI